MRFLRVEIHELHEGTFFARVLFEAEGAEQVVDSRPSDAIALALSRKLPVLVREGFLQRELSPEERKEYEGIVKSVKF